MRAGQGAATRGSARPEAATIARAAGDLAAAAGLDGGGAVGRMRELQLLGGGRKRRGKWWRRRAGHARGKI